MIWKERDPLFSERAWWHSCVSMGPNAGPAGASIFLVWDVPERPWAGLLITKSTGWTTVGDGGDGLTRSEGWRHSLMGCASRETREKGTAVGDEGDGLAKSTDWTTVGDGGNGLTRSKGRRRG